MPQPMVQKKILHFALWYFLGRKWISSWVGGTNAFTAIKFYSHDYSGGGSHGGINGEVKLYGLKGS